MLKSFTQEVAGRASFVSVSGGGLSMQSMMSGYIVVGIIEHIEKIKSN